MEVDWENITLVYGGNCTQPAIDDFPKDLFTEEQRRQGFVLLHVLGSLYLFVALAVVCDKYFVPAVEKICHALNMSNDVAGATFMAAATSAPELFVNVIGTFITEGDIGLGTIVGSAVFNIFGVAGCCGIGAGMIVPLDWWPLTRDCLAYGMTVSILIYIIHDERVEWYEALILVLLYFVYIAIMYYDKTIQKYAREMIEQGQPLKQDPTNPQHNGSLKSLPRIEEPTSSTKNEPASSSDIKTVPKPEKEVTQDELAVKQPYLGASSVDLSHGEDEYKLLTFPKGKWWFTQLSWVLTWPIYLVFYFTIPDCEKPKLKKWFALTFIMCIIWIGSLSYLVAWFITVVGDTLRIPDSVMGITFLAAGTSVPEAVSSVIVAKQGHGSMGISNSIGSNTFDILLCLGLPWLIKSAFVPIKQGQHWVGINSYGLQYSAISLLGTLLLLYVAFYLNKFRLDRRVGNACLIMYAIFLISASLIEMNVFFTVNLPTCGR
ncbi:sodium/potassium/calcium exchanger 4 isoform X2 [Culicoides brevitarsis]|uniref:sodium/potassium/calcium exchanger 4 isoform X2 n=1 Tax=Culicoides brevitarsis TaxID=469753 RepID=UPI00307B4266